MKIGDRVHVNAQDEEWGRIASDATVDFIHDGYILVTVDSIRSTVSVLPTEARVLFERRQTRYCRDNKLPEFAPSDGNCFNCRRYIYDDAKTADSADKELITGCPFCHRTYCD